MGYVPDCQNRSSPPAVCCHNKAIRTDDHVEEEEVVVEEKEEEEEEEGEEENSTGACDTKFTRFQQILDFVALLRRDSGTAATSYGITELPDDYEWEAGGGSSVGGAKDISAEKRRRRRANGCSKKELGRKQVKENGRMAKEAKNEKAHRVISGAYHHLEGHPKKTRAGCSRLFTTTTGRLVCHRPQR
ncbi:unnamed protein product [Taenia asiatica]|uniref:Protein NIM1-like n=1 Tax=Taenia asiatica TaxID=60517 RepID=A0A0R3WDL5_TAEAS|nr:unnamed protein product [Taenia asiatica]